MSADPRETIPECEDGCCNPACHAAWFRPCCGACMSPEAVARRNDEAVRDVG